jgi:MarR family transcriptional regulator, transcriptional regulator for hemolysin
MAESRLPEGRAILRQANTEMTQGLSEEELTMLVDLLRRVLRNVEAMDAGVRADSSAPL